MKRIIVSLLLAVALIASAGVIAYATGYTGSFSVNFTQSFTINPSGTPVYLVYNPGWWIFSDAEAETKVSVPTDGTGMASVILTAVNNDFRSAQSTTLSSDGYIHSGFARVTDQDYAKETRHYAQRSIGALNDHWSYTCN